MKKGLAGSLFVHDALRLDYCLQAAIESLILVCDEVIVLDCGSTDGTAGLLRHLEHRFEKLTVASSPWEAAADYSRLAILANRAREMVTYRWHLMLQADEVLHEASYPILRELVELDGWGHRAFEVRRLNLWRDPAHHIAFNSTMKPCGDAPIRIGHQVIPAVGDAESLRGPASDALLDQVVIFHYGYLRRGLLEKAIEMQSWFWPDTGPDERLVRMRDAGGGFKPEDLIPDSELREIPMPHPVAAAQWLAQWRQEVTRS